MFPTEQECDADFDNGYGEHLMPARDVAASSLYEMLHRDDVPLKVAINEAIELAKRYGDDNSKNFVNGILDRVARDTAKL